MLAALRARARALEKQTHALYIAYRDPRVPWHARVFAALVLAYAVSPIDLIPDFIPVLGYLDDLLLVPLEIALALRMIAAPVMAEARRQAEEPVQQGKPAGRAGALLVIVIWLILFAVVVWAGIRLL